MWHLFYWLNCIVLRMLNNFIFIHSIWKCESIVYFVGADILYDVPVGIIILLSIFYGSISIIAVIGNSLVIWIVATTRQMQTVTNLFIANLALADVVIGMFVIPFQVLYYKFLHSILRCLSFSIHIHHHYMNVQNILFDFLFTIEKYYHIILYRCIKLHYRSIHTAYISMYSRLCKDPWI